MKGNCTRSCLGAFSGVVKGQQESLILSHHIVYDEGEKLLELLGASVEE